MKIYHNNRRSTSLAMVAFLMLGTFRLYAADNSYIKKVTISVYGLKAIGIPQNLAESLQEHLESKLLQFNLFEVLSRNDIEIILKESRFQQTGICSDEECAVQAGHILGVKKVITGTISQVGSTYNIVLKLIDVGTAKLESSVNQKHSGTIDTLLDITETALRTLVQVYVQENERHALEKLRREQELLSQDSIQKLTAELAALKNRNTQLQERYQEEKQKLEQFEQVRKESELLHYETKPIAFSEDYSTAGFNGSDTLLHEKPQENSETAPVDSAMIIENKKKAHRIGVGAIILMGIISITILFSQIFGNSNQ